MFSLHLLSSLIFLLIGFGVATKSSAQDTLPNFKVQDIGNNRYVISWTNNYPYTAQITIQRSFDSLRGYKSILTVPDPTSKQNGFADSKAVNDHMFYRLYILLDNGRYVFTAAKQPSKAPVEVAPSPTTPATNKKKIEPINAGASLDQVTIKDFKKDSAFANPRNTTSTPKEIRQEEEAINETSSPLPVDQLKKAAPIVIRLENIRTGDSAKVPTVVTPQGEPNAYAPSLYVYTHPDGNIRIQVPNRSRLSRYRIRFYELDKSFLFELKNLPAPNFQLDKTNFLHGGWFLFELLDENRILEKHKLYLEKE
ncbi:MAG: hypothetical protein ACO3AY_04990 [Chitinophagaceae bacterium]